MAKFPDPNQRPLSPPLPKNLPSAPIAPSQPLQPNQPVNVFGPPAPLKSTPPPNTPLIESEPSFSPPTSLPPLLVKPSSPLTPSSIPSGSEPPPLNPLLSNQPVDPTPFSPPPAAPVSPLPPMPDFSTAASNQPPLPPQPPAAPSSSPPEPVPESASVTSNTGQIASPQDVKKKPPIKLIILIFACLLLVVGLVFVVYRFITGRSSGGDQAKPPTSSANKKEAVNLQYWGLWEPSSVMESIFKEFESQNPGVTITYTQQSPKDYRERLQSAMAKGTGPDVFRFHNTWVPMLKNDLDQIPATVMSPADFQSTFYPVAANDLKGDKSYYGIPLMIDGLGLYYNKTIFKNASLSPPTSWEDLRKTADQLTIVSKGKIERAGIALGLTSNVDNFSDILGLMLFQNNADPAKPTTSLASDALSYYTIFSTQDKVWDDTLPASTFAFATEKVAMIIAPSWRAHEIKEINPELDFAVTVLPQLPKNEATWATYWVEGVSKKAKSRDMAWKLLQFLSTKDNLRKLYTSASNTRLFGEPFSRVDMADQLLSDPYVGAYIQQAPKAKSWYLSSRTFDNGINDRLIKYYEDAVNAVNKGTDAKTALQTASQGVIQVLTQYSTSSR